MATLPEMLADLAKVITPRPSWAFRTPSGQAVWEKLERLLDRKPNAALFAAIREALSRADVRSHELSPDDFVALSMAGRWKLQQLRASGRRNLSYAVDRGEAVLLPPKR